MPSKSAPRAETPAFERRAEIASAREAGLRYVSDRRAGITRLKGSLGFRYRTPAGRVIRDKATIARINKLAIPPAWSDVWICPDPLGHIQATGRDARKRKQYRYHPAWRACRDETKFDRMLAFAAVLPKIRRRTGDDLAKPGLTRAKVLATVVRLLEKSLIRVGNGEYAKKNGSFGLTTIRNSHVRVRGSTVKFEFKGKSGKRHSVNVDDRRLARVVKACQDLPGQELFEYIDDDGVRRDVGSADVNAYLQEITGEDFTAKDFRTWAGTVLACAALQEMAEAESEARAKRNVVQAVEAVAGVLGNTKAVCRRSYIHPGIIDTYLDGAFAEACAGRKNAAGLRREEAVVVMLLRRLAQPARKKKAA